MDDCGHTECPVHGIGVAINGHGLAFEKPIEVYLHVEMDGHQRAVFAGRAYQNPHGYWAQTDAGIMPAKGIEDALELVNKHLNLEGRGMKRIDPPAAIVQKDSPTHCDPCWERTRPRVKGGPSSVCNCLCLVCAPVLDEDKTKRVYKAVSRECIGAEPTEKSPIIDKLVLGLLGKDRPDTIRAGHCMTCSRVDVTIGMGKEDMVEYRISGMCEVCQREMFDEEM